MVKAIRVSGLTKFYGDLLAVDHISFEVEEGEIFGLLGPNGAGKTTTIKMLTTLLRPSDGTAEVCGYDIRREPDAVRRVIGIVFQEPSLDLELTGRENMEFHARLYDVPKGEMDARIEELLQLVELQDWADRLVRAYSGGMRRRLEIARSLLHHPRVLFLDEPTLGLDPQSRRHVWSYSVPFPPSTSTSTTPSTAQHVSLNGPTRSTRIEAVTAPTCGHPRSRWLSAPPTSRAEMSGVSRQQ